MESFRVYLNRLIVIIAMGILLGAVYIHLAKLTVLKSEDGVMNMMDMYCQPEGAVDVLILGSSLAGQGVDGEVLWRDYGISAYCTWAAEQPLWNSYYDLIEVLKYQQPKVVVLDTYSAILQEDYLSHYRQSTNLSGLRFSRNKLAAVMASSPRDLWDDMILELPVYHDRIFEINYDDYIYADGKGDVSDKGFCLSTTESLDLVHGFCTRETEEIGQLSEKSECYIRKIIDKCNEEGIVLIMIQSPDPEYEYHPFFNRVSEIADEYGIKYINYNLPENDLGLSDDDFFDTVHLNANGARKMTASLGRELVSSVSLTDHRGDPLYESWDRFSAEANKKYICSLQIYDDYLKELERDRYFTTIVDFKYGESASYKTRDYSQDDCDKFIGDERENYVVEYDGHIFTADLQDPYAVFVRFDGALMADVKSSARIMMVYDRRQGEIVDTVVCKDLKSGVLYR